MTETTGFPYSAPAPQNLKWPRYSVPHSLRRQWTSETAIVAFFIPMPEPLDVPHLFEVPIEEVLDPRENSPSIALGNRSGVEYAFRIGVRFHQSEQEVSDPSGTAVMSALGDVLGRTADASVQPIHRPKVFTVAEVFGPMTVSASQDGITDTFDEALKVLRSIQRAHHLVTERPLRLVTRKGLPAALPFLLSSGEVFAKPSVQIFMANVGENDANHLRGPDLNQDQQRALSRAFNDYSPNIFAAFSDMRREANLAYGRGENLNAIILAGAAAEALLVEVMLLMMWEEDLSCADVARVLDTKDTVTKKVTSQFSGRLGGQWNLDRPGPVRDWRINLADLRNAAVHGGQTPDDEKIQTAFKALSEVERHLGDRLVANMRRYPATTQIFLGPKGLGRRGKAVAFWAAVKADETYLPPEPGRYFRRWNQEVDRIRAKRLIGNAENAEILVISYPNGVHRWFVQDNDSGLAAQIPEPALEPRLAQQVAKVKAQPATMPVSTLVRGATLALTRTLNWLPIGEVNPAHPYRRWQVCLIPPLPIEAEGEDA